MGNGTSIGRVRGLGSAHSGAHHWLIQRFTAIGNLISAAFFIVAILGLPNLNHSTVVEWIASPLAATMMSLLIITTFWHARLGVQVVVEDYVHDHANKFACVAALNLVTFLGAAFGLFCILRLALGGA